MACKGLFGSVGRGGGASSSLLSSCLSVSLSGGVSPSCSGGSGLTWFCSSSSVPGTLQGPPKDPPRAPQGPPGPKARRNPFHTRGGMAARYGRYFNHIEVHVRRTCTRYGRYFQQMYGGTESVKNTGVYGVVRTFSRCTSHLQNYLRVPVRHVNSALQVRKSVAVHGHGT